LRTEDGGQKAEDGITEDVADMDIDGCVEKAVDHLESTLLPGQSSLSGIQFWVI